MSTAWESTTADQLQPGDTVRLPSGAEFALARIDWPFLGMEQMVCLIEDNPSKWHAYPYGRTGPVEVQRG